MTELPPESHEQAALDRLAGRLEAARPEPTAAFQSALGAAFVREGRRRRMRARPPGLWLIVVLLSGGGVTLLGAAAAQI